MYRFFIVFLVSFSSLVSCGVLAGIGSAVGQAQAQAEGDDATNLQNLILYTVLTAGEEDVTSTLTGTLKDVAGNTLAGVELTATRSAYQAAAADFLSAPTSMTPVDFSTTDSTGNFSVLVPGDSGRYDIEGTAGSQSFKFSLFRRPGVSLAGAAGPVMFIPDNPPTCDTEQSSINAFSSASSSGLGSAHVVLPGDLVFLAYDDRSSGVEGKVGIFDSTGQAVFGPNLISTCNCALSRFSPVITGSNTVLLAYGEVGTPVAPYVRVYDMEANPLAAAVPLYSGDTPNSIDTTLLANGNVMVVMGSGANLLRVAVVSPTTGAVISGPNTIAGGNTYIGVTAVPLNTGALIIAERIDNNTIEYMTLDDSATLTSGPTLLVAAGLVYPGAARKLHDGNTIFVTNGGAFNPRSYIFDSSGSLVTGPTDVATTKGNSFSPVVLPDGNVLLTWATNTNEGRGIMLNPNTGAPSGSEFAWTSNLIQWYSAELLSTGQVIGSYIRGGGNGTGGYLNKICGL